MDFYEFVKPKEFEHRMRNELVASLTQAVRRSHPDAEVLPFGSFMSKLYLPTADMDIVICSKNFRNGGRGTFSERRFLFKFKNLLARNDFAAEEDIEVISSAKVPLVKFVDKFTGLKVDISFDRYDGVNAIQTFLQWKEQYPAMPILVTLIKHFLVMRGLNEPVSGGIGGFSVICLVTSMLQLMPQVQSRSLVAEHHLGEMLMEFFDLYGNKLDHQNVAIRLNPPGYVHKVRTIFRATSVNRTRVARWHHALIRHRPRFILLCTRVRIDYRLSTQTTRRMIYQAAPATLQSSSMSSAWRTTCSGRE
jgi:non-canonical poly(A) RNA polymerase PAPD5/7